MNRLKYIPFYPLFRFVRIIVMYGGISTRGILHLLPWMVKLVLLEPLRWLEVLAYERKIARYDILHPPVFILGHYRSGTTYLQRIITCDAQFGSMTAFEHVLPEIMLLFEKPMTWLLQRVSNLIRAQNHFHRIPFSWSHPGEEDLGLMALVSYHAASWGFIFPKNFKAIFDPLFLKKDIRSIEAWKSDYLYLVKKISLRQRGKPLVLKSPPNTARAKELLALFPSARFIYISREPDEVFVSTKRLWQITKKLHGLGSSDHIDIDDLVYYTIEMFHRNWTADKVHIPADQFVEVSYSALLQQPAEVMKHIYIQLRLPDYSTFEPALMKFLETQKTYSTLRHVIPEKVKQKISIRLTSTMLKSNLQNPIYNENKTFQ